MFEVYFPFIHNFLNFFHFAHFVDQILDFLLSGLGVFMENLGKFFHHVEICPDCICKARHFAQFGDEVDIVPRFAVLGDHQWLVHILHRDVVLLLHVGGEGDFRPVLLLELVVRGFVEIQFLHPVGVLPHLRVGGHHGHPLNFLVHPLVVEPFLVGQVADVVDHLVLPADLRGDVDLHQGPGLHVVHGRVEPGPDFQIAHLHGLLGVEAVPPHLLELHEAHHLLEEYGVKGKLFGVLLIYDLGKGDRHRILLFINHTFTYNLIAHHVLGIYTPPFSQIELEFFLQFWSTTLDNGPNKFSTSCNFRRDLQRILKNLPIFILQP